MWCYFDDMEIPSASKRLVIYHGKGVKDKEPSTLNKLIRDTLEFHLNPSTTISRQEWTVIGGDNIRMAFPIKTN